MKKKKHLNTVQQEKIAQVSMCGSIISSVQINSAVNCYRGYSLMIPFTSAQLHTYAIHLYICTLIHTRTHVYIQLTQILRDQQDELHLTRVEGLRKVSRVTPHFHIVIICVKRVCCFCRLFWRRGNSTALSWIISAVSFIIRLPIMPQ